MPYLTYGTLRRVKTTIYLPDELHRELKQVAKARGTSESELIRTAIRHELLGAPPEQTARAEARQRLMNAIGTLNGVYPPGYLEAVRTEWRG